MSKLMQELSAIALSFLLASGAVTLTYADGHTETYSYAKDGDEAPCWVEGAFVEATLSGTEIVEVK